MQIKLLRALHHRYILHYKLNAFKKKKTKLLNEAIMTTIFLLKSYRNSTYKHELA